MTAPAGAGHPHLDHPIPADINQQDVAAILLQGWSDLVQGQFHPVSHRD
jgi:hypothetical protein